MDRPPEAQRLLAVARGPWDPATSPAALKERGLHWLANPDRYCVSVEMTLESVMPAAEMARQIRAVFGPRSIVVEPEPTGTPRFEWEPATYAADDAEGPARSIWGRWDELLGNTGLRHA